MNETETKKRTRQSKPFFPLLCEIGGKQVVIQRKDELPIGRDFKILQVAYTPDWANG